MMKDREQLEIKNGLKQQEEQLKEYYEGMQ